MDKKIRDSVDNIVRLIPIRKIRDSVRELLFFHIEKKLNIENLIAFNIVNETSDNLVIKCIASGFTAQIEHYMLGRYIELKHNKKIKYDLNTWYDKPNINGTRKSIIELNRNFELLNLFPNLNIKVANEFEVYVYKKLYDIRNYGGTLKDCLSNMKRLYISDNLSIRYYPNYDKKLLETIRDELDFDKYLYPLLKDKNLDYYNEIKSSKNSIGVHIRRGDYLIASQTYAPHIIVPDENYFTKAIELISTKVDIKKAKLFFFSDSMEWVSEHIIPKIKNKYDYVLVSENDDASGYLDFYLLMSTQHQIASVGRFCHLAHFFNSYKDKLIIARSKTMKPEILYNFVLPT